MEIGLFSNGERLNQIAKTTYDEDLAEVILADDLGVQEAWISEHGTFIRYQAPDQLPCAELFICKATALTKQIRMGPGIAVQASSRRSRDRVVRGSVRSLTFTRCK